MKPLKAFHDTAAGTLLWLRVHEDICQLFFTVCWHVAWDEIWTHVAETSSCCLQSQPMAGRLEAVIVVCNLKHVHCSVPEVFAINASCPWCIHWTTVFRLFFSVTSSECSVTNPQQEADLPLAEVYFWNAA